MSMSAVCKKQQHSACEQYVIMWTGGMPGTGDRYLDPCDCCAREHAPLPRFGGETYSEPRDFVRLNRQSQLIFDYMKSGNWHTLSEISSNTGEPEASISARLRDFRKAEFGAHKVERQYVDKGLWRYRLLVRESVR